MKQWFAVAILLGVPGGLLAQQLTDEQVRVRVATRRHAPLSAGPGGGHAPLGANPADGYPSRTRAVRFANVRQWALRQRECSVMLTDRRRKGDMIEFRPWVGSTSTMLRDATCGRSSRRRSEPPYSAISPSCSCLGEEVCWISFHDRIDFEPL